MKIQGYELGTKVKWSDKDSEGFCTGIVRARYYDPDITEINGEEIEINVVGKSPTYEIEDADENVIVITHTKVTIK